MNFKKLLMLGLTLVAAMVLGACSKTDKPKEEGFDRESVKEAYLEKANEVTINENSVTFKDSSTRDALTINKGVENVMVLYGSFTTLWYEAGGTVKYAVGGDSSIELYNEYIGRDITQDEGVEVVATSSAASRWSVETMIEKNPGLIVASSSMKGYETISGPATSANIPVLCVDYSDFSDYLKWFKVFSALTNNENLYETIALDALDKVVDVIEATSKLESPEVISLFNTTKSVSINTKYTLVGSMINALNGKNIADEFENDLQADRLDMNLESVYAKNPKTIIVQYHGTEEETKAMIESKYGSSPIWKEIDAVKNNNIIYLQPSLYHNKPNAKFALAYQTLAKSLYPNAEFDF